jgi:hypothetical protein
MSNPTNHTKNSSLWKNKAFLTWFIVLVFIGLVGYGLFFWSAAENERFARDSSTRSQQIEKMESSLQSIGRLIEIDGRVIMMGEYEEALASYRSLSDELPDTLQAVVQLRISQIEEMLTERPTDEGPDPKELILNKYRKDIAALEEKTDSLQSAMISQSAVLNTEITALRSEIDKKEKALQKKEKVEVITFNSTTDAKIHYLGEVENGKANGGGIGIWSTGSVYRGDWKNNLRHGQGTYEWADGEVYEGTFVEGRREGQGKYYWPSGERYEGQWVNNRRNGEGTLFDIDGNVRYKGKWKDDKPAEK